jgi:hypothetical protein
LGSSQKHFLKIPSGWAYSPEELNHKETTQQRSNERQFAIFIVASFRRGKFS